ncbi:DUF6586 family protein [Psychrobacter lutiphocae]|uniref:DUF6586 family protein n=1 Tax=Psychrobacter lutiphocae TaxID=540500 RepID=UPI00037081DF|nr:DUF6586 family protein [Psychrobacter lutiphocae]
MAEKGRVARYQADRTNQKFYFCRLACKQAGETTDKQLYQAYCETAIFHLQGALWALLQELAHFYNLDTTQPTIDYIEAELAKKTLISPEIQRIRKSLDMGVLAHIQKAYQRCQYAPAPDSKALESSQQDLIVNVVTLSNQWLPDEQSIREWRRQFMSLVDEMRGGMVEY